MTYNLLDILKLIGAVGLFIYGMKLMSEGIQKIAGKQLRNILNAVTANRFTSIFSGLVTTALVQASSATTVMVVSFTNAGLLKLKQAIAITMGAHIGTTLKALLWAVFGFSKFDLSDYALPLVAFGFPFLFSQKSKRKAWSEFLIGFALLFMSLAWIKDAVPQLSPNVLSFLRDIGDYGVLSWFIYVILGALISFAIQSSSAAFAITIVLCNQGVIGFEAAACLVLGENIGTTATANIAALVANIHGKRAALAHTLIKVFGAMWMLLILPLFLKGIDLFLIKLGQPSPINDVKGIEWGIALFHIFFNVSNTIILVWFIDYIEKILIKIMPTTSTNEAYSLEYLGSGFMKTPELALLEAYKEVAKFGKMINILPETTHRLLDETDRNKQELLWEKIRAVNKQADRAEEEIANYLAKLSEDEISSESSLKVRSLLSVTSNLKKIADIYSQMTRIFERKVEQRVYFLPEQREGLKELFRTVDRAFALMQENLNADSQNVNLDQAKLIETEINIQRKALRQIHLIGIENGDFSLKSATVYSEIYSASERIGDNLIKISEALAGQ